jgi:sodium/proline symporter
MFPANYWNFFSSGKADWSSWADILSGLGWGLGYFGMPHIIVRFMAIRSRKDVKKGTVIGITWNILILIFAVAAGTIGRLYLGEIDDSSTVFIQMVRHIFPSVISGVLLSAILAAAMSTADSQLLASASAFAADVYKPVLRKEAKEKEMMWVGRIVVIIISIVAVFIASNPGSGTIMSLVENAWGIFGAAFGPVILLSLFWKRFTFIGAIGGIITGAAVDAVWLAWESSGSGIGLYEIIPGFLAGLIVAVVVTLISKAPGKDVEELFTRSVEFKD